MSFVPCVVDTCIQVKGKMYVTLPRVSLVFHHMEQSGLHASCQGCRTSVSVNRVNTAHLVRHNCFFIMFHFIVTDLNLTHWHWN